MIRSSELEFYPQPAVARPEVSSRESSDICDMTDSEGSDRRSLEDRVVSTVEHQTGGPQPDSVPEHVLLIVLSTHGGEDADRVREAIGACVDSGRLESDGDRYWIPGAGDS